MSKKPNLSAVKTAVHKEKFKHGSLAVVFTVVFIAVIIVINVLVSALTTRFPSMNFDLTKEGLNTLSDEATDVAKEIVNETTIYIIGSEDAIRGDEVYSNYSLKYSQVANLADRLHELNDKIKVEYIDPDMNPQFISDYAGDSLTTGKVMVKTDKRHKTLAVTDLFSIQQDSSTGQYNYYSKVDGALANALYLVNLDTVPVVAFATGHNEMLTVSDNLSTFTGMLNDNNFEVKEFNMLTDEIPEDASIVVLGTPTTDYTSDELSKLEAYLGDEKMASSRTLYVMTAPNAGWSSMPNLSSFLAEWGMEPQSQEVLESNTNNTLYNMPYAIFANVTDSVLSKTYDNVVKVQAAPVKRLFTANNDISTYSVIETSDTAYLSNDEKVLETPETDTYTILAFAQRYMDNQGKICANVVVDGCAADFYDGSSLLGNSTFGNKDATLDLIKNLTGTTDTRVGLTVNQTQTNTMDISASSAVTWSIGMMLFTIVVPVAVLVIGLVIFLRRRHL
ncbi:Gldg family protein [Hominenteromicrobium sp.]|uniref:Gldg family protein n=1 Tax=Hominenteromicrobium sp. TaxID=3073581 RepID=UPI003A9013DA